LAEFLVFCRISCCDWDEILVMIAGFLVSFFGILDVIVEFVGFVVMIAKFLFFFCRIS